jgi:hypothetical protein
VLTRLHFRLENSQLWEVGKKKILKEAGKPIKECSTVLRVGVAPISESFLNHHGIFLVVGHIMPTFEKILKKVR